jgi:hypothetical protein
MVVIDGRASKVKFWDTEVRVELDNEVNAAQVLPQLPPVKLPVITWIPSRLIVDATFVARITSPVIVGQALVRASASDWEVIVVVPQVVATTNPGFWGQLTCQAKEKTWRRYGASLLERRIKAKDGSLIIGKPGVLSLCWKLNGRFAKMMLWGGGGW